MIKYAKSSDDGEKSELVLYGEKIKLKRKKEI